VIGVYVSEEIEKCLGELKRWMVRKVERIKTILGGDFNAKMGDKRGEIRGEEESEEGGEIKWKNKKINREGRILINTIEEVGWAIWNGNTKGDEDGELTFIGGGGETVIDYVIGDASLKVNVERLEVEEKIDSVHQPVIWLKVNEKGKGKSRKETGRKEAKIR